MCTWRDGRWVDTREALEALSSVPGVLSSKVTLSQIWWKVRMSNLKLPSGFHTCVLGHTEKEGRDRRVARVGWLLS